MIMLRFGSEDILKGHLVLVNPSNPTINDVPANQLLLLPPADKQIYIEKQAAKMLTEVMSFIGSEEIVPISGYRTMQEQQFIYTTSTRENGEDFTKKYVAIPGCSEHQTGLAIDLGLSREDIDFIRPDFPYTGICGRFRDICVRYGFIERYPAGCEQITGIAHEPWHFRYVGYPHSEVMITKNYTLEEYTEYLKQFSYKGNHLCFNSHWRDFEIFYVPISDNKEVIVQIPDGIPYQASGNNKDGVVLTLWRVRQ